MALFDVNFYHHGLERFIIAFGQLFTGISIVKRDENGVKYKNYPVGIEYGPKHKWISRQREQPDLTAGQIEITLPRISFEITDIQYAPARKIGTNGTYCVGNVNGMRGKIFNPTPYDVIIELRSYCKDQNDSQQILEQILPFFQPYLTLNFEILPEYKIAKDVPITFQGYQQQDTYDTSPEEFRAVQQTFTFAAQMDFFGPLMGSTAVIKDIILTIGEDITFNHNLVDMEIKVNPLTAAKTDIHTIDTTIKELI